MTAYLLYAYDFRFYFTPLPGFFSTFPHGTCPLSDSCQYLALDGVYHPLWAALSNTSPIADKYREGKLKRTLKRESNTKLPKLLRGKRAQYKGVIRRCNSKTDRQYKRVIRSRKSKIPKG